MLGSVSSRRPDIFPYVTAENAGLSGSGGTAVTPSATAHTKGSYTQLIAATTRQTRYVTVWCYGDVAAATTHSWLVDIATGAAASEVVLIPNLIVAAPAQFYPAWCQVRIPCNIATGTRISARAQKQNTSAATVAVKVMLEDGIAGAVGVDSLNANTATSLGTAVTPGNASKSAYVQLIASTSRQYKGFFFGLDPQGAQGGNYVGVAIDLAIGAAASEVVFLPDLTVQDQNGQILPPWSVFYSYRILSGVRIAVRARGSGASNAMGVSLYGVY